MAGETRATQEEAWRRWRVDATTARGWPRPRRRGSTRGNVLPPASDTRSPTLHHHVAPGYSGDILS